MAQQHLQPSKRFDIVSGFAVNPEKAALDELAAELLAKRNIFSEREFIRRALAIQNLAQTVRK